MRCQLVLTIFWLWGATSSQTGTSSTPTVSPTTTDLQCEEGQLHPSGMTYNMTIDCENRKNAEVVCNHSHSTFNCKVVHYEIQQSVTDGEKTAFTECECDECTSQQETSLEVEYKLNTGSYSNSTTIIAVLGAIMGMLVMLLAIVATTLVWTCWLLKKRSAKFNTERQLRSSTDHGQLVNPTYEGDDLLRLQPQQPAPAYETISSHPSDGARLEFIEQGENGYSVLSREQRANPNTITTTRMETILEDNKEESYSKLELREETGSTKKTNDEAIAEYSRLETVNIGSSVPKDTHLDNDATVNSNYDSSEQTERKERDMDDKVFEDNGDALQLESGYVEEGQQEEPSLITITPDIENERNDSNNTSSTESA